MEANYRGQVALLLDVLPEVAKEPVFALHGGTAINLFMRDMHRLSVDIDLTYIPIENRESSLNGITDALEKTRKRVEAVVSGVKVVHAESTGKLLIARKGALVKLEVNLTNRG
jgi:predicted nucleotidyltransferase component of viral defense system